MNVGRKLLIILIFHVTRVSNKNRDFRIIFAKIFDSIFAKIDRHLNPLTSSYQQLTNLVEVMYLMNCNKRFHWSLLSKIIMLTYKKYRGYRRTLDTEDTDGQWIQGNSRYSGYRRRVEKIQLDGQWIQANSR